MSFCQNCGRLLTENTSACPICASSGPAAAVAAPAPASAGIQPTVAGALTYLAGFITGIIFLLDRSLQGRSFCTVPCFPVHIL